MRELNELHRMRNEERQQRKVEETRLRKEARARERVRRKTEWALSVGAEKEEREAMAAAEAEQWVWERAERARAQGERDMMAEEEDCVAALRAADKRLATKYGPALLRGHIVLLKRGNEDSYKKPYFLWANAAR